MVNFNHRRIFWNKYDIGKFMFVAMNRFKIVKGKELEFENVWRNRDTHLANVTGLKI